MAFLDPEDGNVEVTNVRESEDSFDKEDEAEQKEEALGTGAGEESKEADDENITLSTFGHTKDEDGGEGEEKSGQETEAAKVCFMVIRQSSTKF